MGNPVEDTPMGDPPDGESPWAMPMVTPHGEFSYPAITNKYKNTCEVGGCDETAKHRNIFHAIQESRGILVLPLRQQQKFDL